MSQLVPFYSVNQRVSARMKKAALLPMQQTRADLISLRHHTALEGLRTGNGWFGAAESMTRALLLTGFLCESGYGKVRDEVLEHAQRALAAVLEIGKRSGRWHLEEPAYGQFADIVNLHDRQLRTAPLFAYDAANSRLGRIFKAIREQQADIVGALPIRRAPEAGLGARRGPPGNVDALSRRA